MLFLIFHSRILKFYSTLVIVRILSVFCLFENFNYRQIRNLTLWTRLKNQLENQCMQGKLTHRYNFAKFYQVHYPWYFIKILFNIIARLLLYSVCSKILIIVGARDLPFRTRSRNQLEKLREASEECVETRFRCSFIAQDEDQTTDTNDFQLWHRYARKRKKKGKLKSRGDQRSPDFAKIQLGSRRILMRPRWR